MGLLEIIAISISLAMDAFAVSLGVGTTAFGRGVRPAFRLAFHFGLFQFFMPIIGWTLGTFVARYISDIDHWIALLLLVWVGGRMILSGVSAGQQEIRSDPTRGVYLIALSVATSIDALAVGLGMAMLKVSVIFPSVLIGCITCGMSFAGVYLGKKLAKSFGKRMEVLGGVILVGIGVKILAEHLAG